MSRPRDEENGPDGYPPRPRCGLCGHSSDTHPMVEVDGETRTRCKGEKGKPCRSRCRRFVFVVEKKRTRLVTE